METKEESPAISRKKAAQERRAAAKRERNRLQYQKNRQKRIEKVQERRREIRESTHQRKHTRRSVKEIAQKTRAQKVKEEARAKEQARRAKIREQTRERVRKHRERKQRQQEPEEQRPPGEGFKNRTSKKRRTDVVKAALPATPTKKAAVIKTIIESPRTRKILEDEGMVKTPSEEKQVNALKALATDISEGLQHVKRSGSNEKRAAFSAFKSLAFGRNVKKAKAKRSLSTLVNLNEKSISKAIQRREKILKGDVPSWIYTKRKVRKDAITEEDGKVIFNYWTKEASRPTGDKKDVVKQRTGKQQYVQHAKHVLEKTQTEAYLEFRELHPEVNVKPFFVKQAKERDRKSCLCRKHVEMQIVFTACMKFRKAALKNSDQSVPVPKTVTECVNLTLCPKQDGASYHNIKCLERGCTSCGVDAFDLLPEEKSEEGSVHWSRYEYISTGKFLPDGKEKKKISLIQKDTPPVQLFSYFKELLKVYPGHSFMARWQREQLDSLLDHLPLGHVVCVHDYSEGYTCRKQDEIQSEYFDVAKVSLHVTILYRHAVEAVDGVESTEEDPHTIKEHIFVISDDPGQDHDSVHRVQELINSYLTRDVKYNILKMHEFTDGCSAQYKSRHCLGDLSCSLADYGYLIQRNFFETSHAKGEQDAAGSHIKQKVSQAVLRRTATITNARSMHEFLLQSFSLPAASSFSSRANSVHLKRRIFFYVPASGEGAIQRNRPGRQFKTLKGIMKLHCVKTLPQQEKLLVRLRSCYCVNCVLEDQPNCLNKDWLDEWKEVSVPREAAPATTRQDTEIPVLDQDTASHIADLAVKGSTVAIAAVDDPVYDFYLLQVTSDGVQELDDDFTDDYSSHYYKGSEVLKGHFYLRDNIHDMTYTLDTKRVAAVFAATVRHICSDLQVKRRGRKPIYKLSLVQHEDIIASM